MEHFLMSQPSAEVTLQGLIQAEDRAREEAKEIMPYSFDECTYSKGYLRQTVFACLDCGEKGVCYSCSISCHADHRLAELFVKRHFRCDCPTAYGAHEPGPSSASSKPGGPSRAQAKCTLNPPETQPQPPNEENVYSHNFAGKFCRCGRDYNPETEIEAMIACIACEDWFHESCLNLRKREGADASKLEPDQIPRPDASGADDEDDEEEADCLIPSESYDSLVCGACVRKHPLLARKAGTPGWMVIEPDAASGEMKVIGRPSDGADPDARDQRKKEDPTQEEPRPQKREAEEDGADRPGKRAKPEEPGRPLDTQSSEASSASEQHSTPRGHGDVFLADGIREGLKTELDPDTIASLPFPLEDEEIYEPPQDDTPEESMDAMTTRLVSTLPRVQAIEALLGYQKMKSGLMAMLNQHVQSGQTVSKEDIDEIFSRLREQEAR